MCFPASVCTRGLSGESSKGEKEAAHESRRIERSEKLNCDAVTVTINGHWAMRNSFAPEI